MPKANLTEEAPVVAICAKVISKITEYQVNKKLKCQSREVAELDEQRRQLLCDPQTSGGLLVAVDPASEKAFLEQSEQAGLDLQSIGEIIPQGDKLVYVE